MPDWRRERRQLPAHLIAEAAANPGGSVAEIDGSVVSDPHGYVPPEAIIGVFRSVPMARPQASTRAIPGMGPCATTSLDRSRRITVLAGCRDLQDCRFAPRSRTSSPRSVLRVVAC